MILTQLETETLSPAEYNALLLSENFWNAQMGRKKILVFQTDALDLQQQIIGEHFLKTYYQHTE